MAARVASVGASSRPPMASRLARVLAVIEYPRLISRCVDAHLGNRMPKGQPGFAGFDEFKVLRGGGDIAFAEFGVNDSAGLGQVADHRHVAGLPLVGEVVGEVRGFFLGDKMWRPRATCLGSVELQGVRGDAGLPDAGGDDTLMNAIKPRETCARTRAAQPVANSIGAGRNRVPQERRQRGVALEGAQGVSDRPPPVGMSSSGLT